MDESTSDGCIVADGGVNVAVDAMERELWAERIAIAESWEPEPDADWEGDRWADAAGLTPAAERWIAAEFHREELLFEWERAAEQLARWQAAQVRILAESLDLAVADQASGSDADLSVRSLAAELACAVGLSDRTVQQHMNDAVVMRDRFAKTFTTLSSGRMSRAHAQVIVDEGWRLESELARAEYERLVLERGAGLTTGRLRALAKAIAETLMPTTITERHADARTHRQIWFRDAADGMADFGMHGPAALVHGMHDRITQLARTVQKAAAADAKAARKAAKKAAKKAAMNSAEDVAEDAAATDDRTLDQIRADVLVDLVLTGHATTAEIDRDGGEAIDAIRGIVQITIPARILIAADDTDSAADTDTGREFATLAGGCPIDADSARRIAATAHVWDRVFTDPVTGHIVEVDRRFSTEAQRRLLRVRDEHCRFPGCRMPVWRCDLDHTVDYQYGGATEPCNLAHLCRRHHMLKHNSAWRVEQREGGVLIWTSPLGRTYVDRPPPVLRFVPT